MHRARFLSIRLPLLLVVLLGPSCFSLPKVEVIRVIDDFTADAGPTWNAFEPWTCGLHVDRAQGSEGGQDAGPDGGVAADMDGGQAVSCTLANGIDEMDPPIPPSTVIRTLVATFDLTTPSSVEVVTRSKLQAIGDGADAPTTTVNLNGFSELIFNAKLVPIAAPLPTGTELHVELHCSSSKDPLVDQDISALTAGVTSWKTITLPFRDFTVAAQREACLSTVESIAFVVVPGSTLPGTKVSGTLQLDNIRLQ